MRLLVFGGSFNPVHIGHLAAAEELAAEFCYDRVLFVPAFSPPHKEIADDPGPRVREAMLELAIRGNPRFALDDLELEREGPSYTIDTIRSLKGSMDMEGKPGLVVGEDLVLGFPAWKEAVALAEECDIIRARRPGFEAGYLPFPHRAASNPMLAISSSMIREKIRKASPYRYLVPEPVYRYIESEGFYAAR